MTTSGDLPNRFALRAAASSPRRGIQLRRWSFVAAIGVALAVLVTACGGSEGGGAGATQSVVALISTTAAPTTATAASAAASSAAAASSSAAAASAASSVAAAAAANAAAVVAACASWDALYLQAINYANPSATRATQAAWEATWTAKMPAGCTPAADVLAALQVARATAAQLEDAGKVPVAAVPAATGGGGGGAAPTTAAAPAKPASPGNSKNCSDFSTHAQAQAWFDTYYPYYGDVAGLDADNDGSACETLP
jgi:hypothetical protein